ncbi:hypothetical protein FB446DRAFT_410068 [Lentinula raphanica]|nr:hypothetical protein FB446DRAFT_410068 [Lentinula raphanica]
MPRLQPLSIHLLATTLLGLFAVARPLPTPSSHSPPSLAPPSQIARRADNSQPLSQTQTPFTKPLKIGRVALDGHWIRRRTPHRSSDTYVFFVGDDDFDLQTISQRGSTTTRNPFPRYNNVPSAMLRTDYFQPLNRVHVQLTLEMERSLFATLNNLEELKEKCKRTGDFVDTFDYVDCAWEYIADSDYIHPDDRRKFVEACDAYKAKRLMDLFTSHVSYSQPASPRGPAQSASGKLTNYTSVG